MCTKTVTYVYRTAVNKAFAEIQEHKRTRYGIRRYGMVRYLARSFLVTKPTTSLSSLMTTRWRSPKARNCWNSCNTFIDTLHSYLGIYLFIHYHYHCYQLNIHQFIIFVNILINLNLNFFPTQMRGRFF